MATLTLARELVETTIKFHEARGTKFVPNAAERALELWANDPKREYGDSMDSLRRCLQAQMVKVETGG